MNATVDWQEFPGQWVLVHAPRGSFASRLAPEIRREADRAADVLARLLEPSIDARQGLIDIYLVDEVDPEHGRQQSGAAGDTVTETAIVQVLNPDQASEPIGWPLTHLLVQRWYGHAPDPVIVDGLAGVVLARTGTGPSLRNVDEWAKDRTAAGGELSVVGDPAAGEAEGDRFAADGEDEPPAPGAGDQFAPVESGDRFAPVEGAPGAATAPAEPPAPEDEFQAVSEISAAPGAGPLDEEGKRLAATSFVAYLIDANGIEAVRRFLAEHDPARRDAAATAAFQQPLPGLEESWLASLGRSAGRGEIRAFIGHLRPLFRPYWPRQVEVVVYMVLGAILGIISVPVAAGAVIGALGGSTAPEGESGILAQLLGEAQNWLVEGDTFERLLIFLAVLLVVLAIVTLLEMRREVVSSTISQRLLIDLQERVFDHLQRLPHGYYSRANVGDLMSRLTGDLQFVSEAMTQTLNIGLFTIVTMLVAATSLAAMNLKLALAVIVVIPIFYAIYRALGTRLSKLSYERMRRSGEAASLTQETLSAHAVIKAFGLEERSRAAYHARLTGVLSSTLRMVRVGALYQAGGELATAIAELLVLGYGGYLVLHDQLALGVLVAFIGILPTLLSPLTQFSEIGEIVQEASGSLARVLEVLEEPLTIADAPGATQLPPIDGSVKLEDVTFGYEDDRPVLRGFDIDIPPGANVAIVGPSGSGKSTILNLLMRFWDPQEGRVLVDGHDVRDVTLASLRSQVGMVFQDTFVFDSTIRENIAIGRPGASDAEIEAAAKGARLDEHISKLPDGYETALGERGVRMSGGQRQRLAIARVLLRDPRIMVLDEATSALDPETEAGIVRTLDEAAEGRTTITITHRLTLAAGADRIFVLDQGRLVEQGTHEELLAQGGLYRSLHETQMQHQIGGADERREALRAATSAAIEAVPPPSGSVTEAPPPDALPPIQGGAPDAPPYNAERAYSDDAMGSSKPAEPALEAGETVGPFRIESYLGEGATGQVFKAVRDSDGETVALKLMRRELWHDETFRKRFLHEARAASEVHDKHLVPVVDSGEADDWNYLAVEFVEGRSLDARIAEEKQLPLRDTVRIAGHVAAGLDALHGHEIIHRDVKPSNIMLTTEGRAALTDFGLAKGRGYSVLTKPGQVMGTLDYIAPELIKGERATPASDIYALGCVVYECIAGRAPFADRSVFQVGLAHLEDQPQDLVAASNRTDLPDGLSKAVLWALNKDPEERPRTATAYARMVAIGGGFGGGR